MNRPASPLSRWREIVHPIFWPVFFWNLRRFAGFLRLRIEAGGNGLIRYDVTWWGGIRIYELFDPDAPTWDSGLEGCSRRVHIDTLDVLNPYLTQFPQVPAQAGIHGSVSLPEALLASFIHGSLPAQGPAGLHAGTFPNLPFINTS